MSGMTIKPRPEKDAKPEPAPRAAAEVLDDLAVKTGKAKPKPKTEVKALGAKDRLGSYVTPLQKRRLKILAAYRGTDMSKIVGILIDEAAEKANID